VWVYLADESHPPVMGPSAEVWPHLIADKSHPPIMGPGEGVHRRVPVVDELDGPAAFVLRSVHHQHKLAQVSCVVPR
jgi:hypothetical protein